MSRRSKRSRAAPQQTPSGVPPSSKLRSRAQTFEGSIEQRILVWLIGLKIAALIVVFDAQSDQAFDFAKSIAGRAFAWMLLAMLVVTVMRYGWRLLPRGPLALAVAAFVLANAISGFFADNAY